MGMENFEQCIYTGGIRRHEMDEPEIEVLIDGLNLARAESHKHVSAGLHYGGGKITVQADPVNLDDKDELGFLAFALGKVRFFTGPDMKMCIRDRARPGKRHHDDGPRPGRADPGQHRYQSGGVKGNLYDLYDPGHHDLRRFAHRLFLHQSA